MAWRLQRQWATPVNTAAITHTALGHPRALTNVEPWAVKRQEETERALIITGNRGGVSQRLQRWDFWFAIGCKTYDSSCHFEVIHGQITGPEELALQHRTLAHVAKHKRRVVV